MKVLQMNGNNQSLRELMFAETQDGFKSWLLTFPLVIKDFNPIDNVAYIHSNTNLFNNLFKNDTAFLRELNTLLKTDGN